MGSLLEPGFGLLGPGAGGVSLRGASASPSACWGWSPVSPLDLLVLAAPCVVPSSSPYLSQFWLSSVSSAASSCFCCSGPASVPPENIAVAMPLGWYDLLLPRGVCLVLTIPLKINLDTLFTTCQAVYCIVLANLMLLSLIQSELML